MAVEREENLFLERFKTAYATRTIELIQVLIRKDEIIERIILDEFRNKRQEYSTLIQRIKNGDTITFEQHLMSYRCRQQADAKDCLILATTIHADPDVRRKNFLDIEAKSFDDTPRFTAFLASVAESWQEWRGSDEELEETAQDNIDKTMESVHGVLMKYRGTREVQAHIEKIRTWNILDKSIKHLEERFESFYQDHLAMSRKIIDRISYMSAVEYAVRIETGFVN